VTGSLPCVCAPGGGGLGVWATVWACFFEVIRVGVGRGGEATERRINARQHKAIRNTQCGQGGGREIVRSR
jgi:hypothetical protein